MKILITGNHTCANRGDAAILRGLIKGLHDYVPHAKLHIVSRFVMAGKFILDRDMVADKIYLEQKSNSSLVFRIKKRISLNLLLLAIYEKNWARKLLPYFFTPAQKQFQNDLKSYSHIIQVGGSFFVDLYGIGQFENILLCLFAKKDVVFLGHSLGPFQEKKFNRFAKKIFPKINAIYLREAESLQLMKEAKLVSPNILMGADTAWLLPEIGNVEICSNEFAKISDKKYKKLIALTVRNLAPFDRRLGITQKEFEQKIVDLINSLADLGHHIVAVSMCTGLDAYNKDDRVVALRIKNNLAAPEAMTVLMNEYNDLEIGKIFQQCDLLIGTRLHSVIISLRYNTPAIAVLYEHKSKGVLLKIGLENYSFSVNEIGEERMISLVNQILNNKTEIKDNVKKEINKAITMIKTVYPPSIKSAL